jgi:cbb3-type cytochrome oxidase maturation protein
MESLLLLIPLSALVVIGAVVVFFRAVDAGQFEDVERQGRTALFDDADDPTRSPKRPRSKSV